MDVLYGKIKEASEFGEKSCDWFGEELTDEQIKELKEKKFKVDISGYEISKKYNLQLVMPCKISW